MSICACISQQVFWNSENLENYINVQNILEKIFPLFTEKDNRHNLFWFFFLLRLTICAVQTSLFAQKKKLGIYSGSFQRKECIFGVPFLVSRINFTMY